MKPIYYGGHPRDALLVRLSRLGSHFDSRQTREKLHRLYEDQMRITFEKVCFQMYLVTR